MELRISEDRFVLELSATELEAFQAGLRETLEALNEAEFATRTGMERDDMRAILQDLVAQKKASK